MRQFSADGAPLPQRGKRGDAAKDWLSLIVPLLAILGTLAGFWLIFQAANTPAPTRQIPSYEPSFGTSPSSTYPPELIEMAIAVSTSLAPTRTPTPTPTTPTPEPVIVTPSLICGDGVTIGATCSWGPEPTPTSTPIPVCLTPIPNWQCVWMGNAEIATEERN